MIPRGYARILPIQDNGEFLMETRSRGKDYARVVYYPKGTEVAGRYGIEVGIPGYAIGIRYEGSLGDESNDVPVQEVLEGMADVYLERVIKVNKHKYRRWENGVPDDIDEQNGRRIREAKKSGTWVKLEHK